MRTNRRGSLPRGISPLHVIAKHLPVGQFNSIRFRFGNVISSAGVSPARLPILPRPWRAWPCPPCASSAPPSSLALPRLPVLPVPRPSFRLHSLDTLRQSQQLPPCQSPKCSVLTICPPRKPSERPTIPLHLRIASPERRPLRVFTIFRWVKLKKCRWQDPAGQEARHIHVLCDCDFSSYRNPVAAMGICRATDAVPQWCRWSVRSSAVWSTMASMRFSAQASPSSRSSVQNQKPSLLQLSSSSSSGRPSTNMSLVCRSYLM